MFSFHFGKKEKLAVLTKHALLLCIVDKKLFIIRGCSFKRNPPSICMQFATNVSSHSGIQMRSEAIFY